METVERVMTEHEQRAAVVREALSWLGTPYHHAARIKGAGVDCGQILAAVYEAAGLIPHVEPEPYPHDWHLHRGVERYRGHVEQFAHRTDRTPQPGDVALFRWGRCISHGAIVIAWPQVLHAFVGLGVILDDADANMELRARFAGAWTFWGEK